MSDTQVDEPYIRALLGTASHLCEVAVFKPPNLSRRRTHCLASYPGRHGFLPPGGKIPILTPNPNPQIPIPTPQTRAGYGPADWLPTRGGTTPILLSSSSLLLSSLGLSDAQVDEPYIRALLGTASHFCEVVVLKPLNAGRRWNH